MEGFNVVSVPVVMVGFKKNGISFENLRIGLFNLSAVGDKGTRLRTGTVHVLW